MGSSDLWGVMGEAKRRKAEIERLKTASPEEVARLRLIEQDEKLLARAIAIDKPDPRILAALVRRLFDRFESAKRSETVDAPISYLNSKIDTTTAGFCDVK